MEERSLLKELEEKAEDSRRANLERLKTRYSLARSLGFNSTEARILSTWPEERIRQVAEEKRKG